MSAVDAVESDSWYIRCRGAAGAGASGKRVWRGIACYGVVCAGGSIKEAKLFIIWEL